MDQQHLDRLCGLKDTVAKNHHDSNPSMIEQAFFFSMNAHHNQKRESGEPYFIHPLAVAEMVAENGLDDTLVAAALMHDVIEDTKVDSAQIRLKFGKDIYSIIDGLTKLDKAAFRSRQEHSTASTIKTIRAASHDIRVMALKLFDKLHNMRTIGHLAPDKQKRIAADCLTVYTPLAHQLGMHKLKYEFEDLCFATLEPKKFSETRAKAGQMRKEKSADISKAIDALRPKLLHARFEEKIKSFYSIYSKMIAQNKQVKELNDTLILKIIVPEKEDCYAALGIVHSTFKPIPGKFKDFIAIPEHGIYRSLHTQVIGPSKKPVKVYIFSREMDQIADQGVLYLLKKARENEAVIRSISNRFLKVDSSGISDGEDLAGQLGLDFHNSAMVVFSEDGQVMNIPLGSTALDFAFFRNERGVKNASKAEINGKISNLWSPLNPGDRVKIHYSLTRQFSPNWASFVNSAKAKRIIEKEIGKSHLAANSKLAKLIIEAVDRPGLLAAQAEIISKNGLDMEVIRAVCRADKSTCSTEILVRNSTHKGIQKAIRNLREMEETLNLSVEYME